MKVAVKQKPMSHSVSWLLVHCSQQQIIHSPLEMVVWVGGGGGVRRVVLPPPPLQEEATHHNPNKLHCSSFSKGLWIQVDSETHLKSL